MCGVRFRARARGLRSDNDGGERGPRREQVGRANSTIARANVRGSRKKSSRWPLDFLNRGVDSQRDRFRKEFKLAEESTKATIAKAERIAAAVEETRRRVEGRGKLKDLTYCKEWIASVPNGNSWCRICSANYVGAGITDQRSLSRPGFYSGELAHVLQFRLR